MNPEALKNHQGIIANPNCSTIQMMVALEPIRQAFGLERIIVSTYQAVSGAGIRAINELKEQAEDFLEENLSANGQLKFYQLAVTKNIIQLLLMRCLKLMFFRSRVYLRRMENDE